MHTADSIKAATWICGDRGQGRVAAERSDWKQHTRGFRDAGNVLIFDVGVGYLGVFSL